MHIYTTQDFDERVEQYRLGNFVKELKSKLITEQDIGKVFKPFPPYWKIRRSKLYRIFAKEVMVDEEKVLCFIGLFMRKSNDYKNLLQNPRQVLDPLVPSVEDLRIWLARKPSEVAVSSLPPALPVNLLPWLAPPRWLVESAKEELLIYESEEWVLRFRQSRIQDYWYTYLPFDYF